MDIDNETLVAAQADRDALPAAIDFLAARIAEDRTKLAFAVAALRVTAVHRGVALECKKTDDGDVLVCAVGHDVWSAGRRALVFRDDRSGQGWSARLHFRPNVKTRGSAEDPGSFDYPDRATAMTAAMEWAATGRVTAHGAVQLLAPTNFWTDGLHLGNEVAD